MDSNLTKNKKLKIEKVKMVMPGVSLQDELLAFSQEVVAIVGNTVAPLCGDKQQRPSGARQQTG